MKALLIAFLLLAGQGGPRFDTYEWDFGRINEADGAVSHTFVLMNDSPSPVRISRAIPGCTCIMASFPQEEIAPGQLCEVEVFYSPSGANGVTYRNIEIMAAGGASLGTLNVKADVVPADRSIQERYLYTVADLMYVSKKNIPFGYLGHGKTLSKVIYLANAAKETVELEASASGSPYFSVSCPAAVGPGKEVPVLLTWAMPSDPSFIATCRDTVRFSIDGRRSVIPVAVSAICTDVAEPSPSAPLLQTYPSQAQLKKGLLSRSWSGEISIENAGKSDLEILAVEAPVNVSVDLEAGARLAPGKRIKVSASVREAAGFRINLFTNDPVHPYKELIYKP